MIGKVNGLVKKVIKRARYWITPFLERMPDSFFPSKSRRLHGYCFGMPKTGAAPVIARMFLPEFRAAHEPEVRFFSYRVLAYRNGKYSRRDLEAYLRKRDNRLQLEMESSYLNSEIVDVLVDLFPDAKFVLTMQDCFSWLEAFVNFQFKLKKPSRFSLSRDRVKLDHLNNYMQMQSGQYFNSYAEEEAPLQQLGFLSLDACFAFWKNQNERILRAVPAERLLVLRVDKIDDSRPLLETFFGIPGGSLSAPFRTPPVDEPTQVLESIPKEFIWKKAQEHCGTVMMQHFPEIWRENTSIVG